MTVGMPHFSHTSSRQSELTNVIIFFHAGVMGCGAAEATGVCFVVIDPRVRSANRVAFGLKFPISFTPPPQSWPTVREASTQFAVGLSPQMFINTSLARALFRGAVDAQAYIARLVDVGGGGGKC